MQVNACIAMGLWGVVGTPVAIKALHIVANMVFGQRKKPQWEDV